jgi:hypothetical protein
MIKLTLAEEDLFVWLNPDHIISIRGAGKGRVEIETMDRRGYLVSGDPNVLADIVSKARLRHVQLVPS